MVTTNDIRKLPNSLIRRGRIDKIFHMNFPTGEDAQKTIAFYLQHKNVADDIDTEEIARFAEGKSCAYLETIINEAGLYAGFEDKTQITQDCILKAILNDYGFGTEGNLTKELLRRRAIHEAGHAVATEIFYPGAVTFAVISKEYETKGGMVKRKRNSEVNDISNLENDIMISLAGKAATEIILQEVDFGSIRDLHIAFDSTRELIDDKCSYGFDIWCHGYETSHVTRDKLDNTTSLEMARYYAQVKKLLNDNRAFLEAFVEKLLEKNTLSYKDIAAIREAVSNKAA